MIIFIKDSQKYRSKRKSYLCLSFHIHSILFSSDELYLGHEASSAFRSYTAVARGNRDYNIRAQEPESGLSEETQVKCLVDQATDPNILGRTREGWEPWM